MVSPCSDRIARVPPYSWLASFEIRTGLSPATARRSKRFRLKKRKHWPVPRSLAATNGVSLMSFPPGTEMFQFPGFAFVPYEFRHKSLHLISASPTGQVALSSRSTGLRSPQNQPVNLMQTPKPNRRNGSVGRRIRARPDPKRRNISGPSSLRGRNRRYRRGVSPFGNPRIKACSQLPKAYRSVPRPSSPLSAKASTERPFGT